MTIKRIQTLYVYSILCVFFELEAVFWWSPHAWATGIYLTRQNSDEAVDSRASHTRKLYVTYNTWQQKAHDIYWASLRADWAVSSSFWRETVFRGAHLDKKRPQSRKKHQKLSIHNRLIFLRRPKKYIWFKNENFTLPSSSSRRRVRARTSSNFPRTLS